MNNHEYARFILRYALIWVLDIIEVLHLASLWIIELMAIK